MASISAALLAGGAMGLASALHCGAMCSGVCGAALMMLQPGDRRQQAANVVMLHAGRITLYAIFGAVGAAIGSSLMTPDIAEKFRALQWAAAIALMAMGLAMAGLLPRLAAFERSAGAVTHAIENCVGQLRRWPRVAPFALGLSWGANACPMVYGAVFTAMLTGSAVNGAAFMTAFGLGTVPALVATGYGLSKLRTLASRTTAQTACGLAIAIAGFASLYAPALAQGLNFSTIFCVTP